MERRKINVTLQELKTKNLAGVLQEKELCLLVLDEEVFARIQDNLGRLSEDLKEQLKNNILEGLKQVLITQQRARQELTQTADTAVAEIHAMYNQDRKKYLHLADTYQSEEDSSAADQLLSEL